MGGGVTYVMHVPLDFLDVGAVGKCLKKYITGKVVSRSKSDISKDWSHSHYDSTDFLEPQGY